MQNKIEQIVVGGIETNCWLYALEADESVASTDATAEESAGKQPCIVIDPGEEAGIIASRLGELNWFPAYIFLTHGHIDHIAAIPELLGTIKKSGGAIPKIGIHPLDAHYLGEKSLKAHQDCMIAAGGSAAYVNTLWKPMPEADLLFAEGETAGPFRILHLPGHTPGSVGFYDEKNNVLFSGDTLFRGSWGRTDLPGGNEAELVQSLKRLLLMNKDTVVFPGHGPVTKIKDEQQLTGFFV